MRKNMRFICPVYWPVLLIFWAIFLCQCRQNPQPNDPYAGVQINHAFAANPPLATNVNITQLSTGDGGNNLLYEATLPKDQIKSDVLAVMINDSNKIVLHDDGQNGDKAAGDGIFSTVMNLDTDSLGTFIASQSAEAKKLFDANNEQLFQFKGRLEFPVSKSVLASLKSFANIDRKVDFTKTISFMNPSLIKLLVPVSEAFKHTALTITDPSVVNDAGRTFNPCTNVGVAGGAWTFGKLMTDMAATSGISPRDFVLNWLNTWNADQTVNSDFIGRRTSVSNIINSWQTLSGGAGATLDVNKAPFKLLAIVNRFDLRSGGAYGGGNAGEGRFVFCATDANCNLQSFFVIFEFGVNKTTCPSIHSYAQQWIDLASLPFPDPSYNSALQAITDQFAAAGTNPSKPNGSSLDQLRTNEIILGFPWQLREFNISASTKQLFNVSTKREPQITFNSQGASPNTADIEAFGDFVNVNMRDVINDKMEIPDNITDGGNPAPFIAAHAHTLNPTNFHWDAVVAAGTGHIDNDTARFHISLNTCSGCHGGESNTGNFTQVGLPSTPGGPAQLSPFLTGNPAFSGSPFFVSDRANRPAGAPILWPFNDLERRGRDLLDFSSGVCIPPFHVPVLINQHVPVGVPVELTRRLIFDRITMSD